MAPAIKPFNILDWYWIVGGDTTQVYSSKINDFVPANNLAYLRFLAAGNKARDIDTQANLGQLLAATFDMSVRPVPAGVLDGYSNEVADRTTATYVNRLLFEYENRLRSLEGQPAMSATDFRLKIKGLV